MAAAGRQLDLGCLGGEGRRVTSGRAEAVQTEIRSALEDELIDWQAKRLAKREAGQ